MFSFDWRMRSTCSAWALSCWYSRPFSMAVATWAATATSSAMSSLLSGSPRSLRPRASTAMPVCLDTQGIR